MTAASTATTYAANTEAKLYFTAEFSATLGGITLGLNAPAVLAIEAAMTLKAEWHDGKFQFSGTVAQAEGAAAEAALQKTESAVAALEAKAAAIRSKAADLANHGATLRLYATLMEG